MRCILFIAIILTSCSITQKLPTGFWSGYLSPMNQPDIRTSLNYEVKGQQENVSLQILGPGGMNIPTNELQLTKDTLFFSFHRPETQVLLSCALKKVNKNYFYGRCTDPVGKWATLTMKHNSIDISLLGRHYGGIRCECHSELWVLSIFTCSPKSQIFPYSQINSKQKSVET